MKVAILCQEEPVFLGPFLQGVIRKHPEKIAAVFVAGNRKAGERSKSWRDQWDNLRIYWLILGAAGFFKTLRLRFQSTLLKEKNPRSVAGLAKQLELPVYTVSNPNHEDFHALLKSIEPDIVLNQSELLLKKEVLAIPKMGFMNRHASLLPKFRGRLASFWAHAASPPSYGITIHFVDEGIDTGPIILQQEFPKVDSSQSYMTIMDTMMKDAPELFWKAVERIQQPGFAPTPNHDQEPACQFPTLSQAQAYQQEILKRRKLKR